MLITAFLKSYGRFGEVVCTVKAVNNMTFSVEKSVFLMELCLKTKSPEITQCV
jgi:hypothetical protein